MNIVCHKSFNKGESGNSSTWRELEAINFSLRSFGKLVRGKSVLRLTDNRAAMYITRSGSAKTDLQILALKIYDLVQLYKLKLEVKWIPRDMNKMADYVSKIIDKDDWETTDEFVTDWMFLPRKQQGC